MTTLRLERVARGDFDLAVALLEEATLVRSGVGCDLVVADGTAADAARALAYAGVRADEIAASVAEPAAGLIAATGLALEPVDAALALDVVRLVAAPLGRECARLLRRPLLPLGRHPAERRLRAAALLRGEDAAYLWERRAWGPASAFRDGAVRAVLRPAVFGGPLAFGGSARRAYASQGALARWAFA